MAELQMHCRSRAQKKSIRLIASACSPNKTEAALHRSPPQSAMLAHRFLLLIAVAAAAASGIASAKPTAYEALADYDFPPGILPKGVVAYTVDNATGAFTATLDASASGAGSSICEFSIEGSYSLRYQTKITGKISPDHLVAQPQERSRRQRRRWLLLHGHVVPILPPKNGGDLGSRQEVALWPRLEDGLVGGYRVLHLVQWRRRDRRHGVGLVVHLRTRRAERPWKVHGRCLRGHRLRRRLAGPRGAVGGGRGRGSWRWRLLGRGEQLKLVLDQGLRLRRDGRRCHSGPAPGARARPSPSCPVRSLFLEWDLRF
jgi:hypothetical protein